MNCSKVEIIQKYNTGSFRYPDYSLNIDDVSYLYECFPNFTRLYLKDIPINMQKIYYLNKSILMNENNPKETID